MWPAAVAVLVGIAAVLLFDASSGSPGSGPVDPIAIDSELARVFHNQLLGTGYDYDPSVSCQETSPRAFTCVASMQTPDQGVIQQTIQVSCLPRASVAGQRCWTDSGEALQ
jgi:hypothetical protein